MANVGRNAWFGVAVLTTEGSLAASEGRVAWFGAAVLTAPGEQVTGLIGPDGDEVAQVTVADDGGQVFTLAGLFPTDLRFRVSVLEYPDRGFCYSGVIGQAEWATSEDGVTLEFVAPPLPIGGPYALLLEVEDGPVYGLDDALLVVKRSFTTDLFSLRAAFPPPRDVGPYRLHDEE